MIVGMRHALYAGWIVRIARYNGLDAEPIADPLGNATDRICIHLDDGDDLELIVPPPKDHWTLPT